MGAAQRPGALEQAQAADVGATHRGRRDPMEGGAIWLTTIGAILVLSALIVGIATLLRRRRRSLKR